MFIDDAKNEVKNENEQVKSNTVETCDARFLNLYARLFHRKGPWFNLSDIFTRYYHRDYIRRLSYMNSYNEEYGNMNDGLQEDVSTWNWVETCLIDCFNDVHSLFSRGLIRTFKNEKECGTVVGGACLPGLGLSVQ